MRRAAFGFIFVSVLLNAISFGMIFPILPNLIRSFFGPANAASTASAAQWQSIFGATWGAMQFFSGPVLGMLSDRFGRRPVLLISTLGLTLDMLVMAFAPGVGWLLLGRVVSGLANFSVAGAYVADVSAPEQRAKNFGWMSAAGSTGFLVGPAAGGLLATHAVHFGAFGLDALRTPFLVAAGLFGLNWLYGLLVLPESLPRERRMAALNWAQANPVGSLSLLASHPDLLPLAGVNFLNQFAVQVMSNIFVLYVTLRFHWSLAYLGGVFVVVGLVQIAVQWLAVGPVVKRVGERGAVIFGFCAIIVGFTIFGLSSSQVGFFVALPIFELGGVAFPSLQGLLSRRVPAAEQGRLQGAVQSSGGIAAIAGPLVFPLSLAWALRHLPRLPGLPLLISAGVLAIALLLALRYARPAPAPIDAA
ncbi:MAG TPA: MFS transporter [Caulobacteraceae bacterium]|jgi:DHA1 family tetracycline resistance protein-like MFS transporter|nr:MFS transporter [Caulobacteraceae bacterium]